MKIWLTRHGQTDLNKDRRMQGRSDIPLNETGLAQAGEMRRILGEKHPGLVFDAVYTSPLQRAVTTGAIIAGIPEKEIIISHLTDSADGFSGIRTDVRLIETDFGRYEAKKYYLLGPRMTLYWACPEIFPAPPTVETTASMTGRVRSFLDELEKEDYENVLIACHGGILRVLSGCLENRPRGYKWRPKPHNCEMRVYESSGNHYRCLERILLRK